MEKLDPIHLLFKHPFNMVVAGGSGSGKTCFVRKLLAHYDTMTTIETPRLQVMWAYGQWQEAYTKEIDEFVNVTYFDGVPSEEEILKVNPHILVLDDLMLSSGKGAWLTSIVTKFTHHSNISSIYLTQNLFYNAKNTSDVNRNSHYTVVFRNSRDKSMCYTLARQLCPHNKRYFYDSYSDATRKPFSNLVIDTHPTTPEELLLKTNIFPEREYEPTCDVYKETEF